MTEQKHLKALIRARMARTGESYTAARHHIVKAEARPSLTAAAEFRAQDKHCMKRPMVAFGSGPSRRGVRFAS